MSRRKQRSVESSRAGRLAAFVAVAGLAGVSSAQIAPPPTEPTPAPAPQEPAPVTPPPRQPGQDGGGQSPTQQAEQTLRGDPSQVPLPELPYDSLVKTDANGRVVLLSESPHRLALDVNPLMDESGVERCLGLIAARRDRVEQRVVEHVQLIQDVLGGVIERVEIGNPETIRTVIDVVRPFQELGQLSDDLKDGGALNEQQWAFNWKIAQEYSFAYQRDQLLIASENQDPEAPSPQTVITRVVLNEFMREPLRVYDAMLVEGAGRIDQVMAAVTLTDEQRSDAARLQAGVRDAGTDEARRDAMQAVVEVLTPEQRRAFVQAILDTR